ncbi:glycoside hydrolase family 5 protein [Flavobacterium nackdongense]|uniref:Glycoside hydrolase family 5 protein n=1 Tax=Flavobacterium nackdongense TaxID=2547394 RepID=A0A4P6YDL0_9FLAO|nr:glycoside hydrolase family 5 protein [Flavobacterium nackdongense]QBN20398.1 glycoside hydrolase family 5 protein [Flavobacterium nackdongense]
MKKIIQKLTYLLVGLAAILNSCSSGGDSLPTTDTKTPSNLLITTEIAGATTANPGGDGSGTVLFKATATNATTFQITVEGKTLPMTNGQLSYTFSTAGTNTFTATVTAFNSGKSVSASTTITLTIQGGVTAIDITKAMGPGFNLGNTFDNGANPTSITSIKSIIDIYTAAGMKHVRIPVSWMQSVSGSTLANTGTGKVDFNHSRFLELKAAIDYAISKGLYVVINTHHEHWLKDYYDGSATYNTKFSTLWSDIATYFKDYSNKLIFDILNEPEGTMGQWGAEAGFSFPQPTSTTALNLTRQINKVGYDAIRATAGGNATRIIMVEPNGQGNQGMIEEVYPTKADLPGGGTDKYLVIQVHTYDPWAFCGETGADSAYPGATSIAAAINKVAVHSTLLGVPINYGEFGVGRTSAARNTSVVYEYYRTVKTTTLANNMSFSVWDDRGWFGLISSPDKITYSLSTNNIVVEMMK